MKLKTHHLMSATALAAVLIGAAPLINAAAAADSDGQSAGVSRAFDPASGQINPGFDVKNPSSAARRIPTPEEARAAKMASVPMQPALEGGENGSPTNGGNQPGAATTGSGSPNGNAPNSQTGPTETSQSGGPAEQTAGSPGPIGSTAQTLPAKLSKRNDVLDRVPIMAMPMDLTDQQRQQIYQAVMADKSTAVAGADALQPASVLPADMALNDTHPLPENVQSSPLLKGLNYVKGKNKVLLIQPSTRVVFDQITS